MGLSLGAYTIATAKSRLGVFRCQVVEDRAALSQEPAIVFLKRWHGASGIDRQNVPGAVLNLDGLVGCTDPFERDMWRQRAGTNGVIRVWS
jgi:hypothetical protein